MDTSEESTTEALEEGTSSFGGLAQHGAPKPGSQHGKGNKKQMGGAFAQRFYSFRETLLSFLPLYLRRVIYYPQMDLEYTFTQMVYLLRSPSKVYKLTSWRNQTKNQWARDDPAFVVILCFFIGVSSSCYGLALGTRTIGGFIHLILFNIGLFLGFGVVIATIGWWLSNSFFRIHHSHSVEQQVEWMYAFDIHCNAYFPMFVALYVLQYLMLPILLSDSFVATFLANTLYAAALSYYHYVSFLGYMFLPFLNKEQVTSMLYPIAGLAVTYVVFILLNINAARLVIGIELQV